MLNKNKEDGNLTKIRVGIYGRVSSEEQAKDGLSIEAQKDYLTRYCKERDWNIFDYYVDAGKSGGSIKYRKEFQRLIKDSKEKKFNIILVYKIDRFSRSLKDLILTLDELKELKINFVSATEPVDTTSAMGEAFFLMIGLFAQLERKMTKERMQFIMEDKVSKGLLVGKMPFGYKWNKEKKIIELDEEKAEIVKQVFELRIKKKSWKYICNKFNLSPQTYYNIIKNKVYCGYVVYNGKLYKGNHPKIIEENVFDKINRLVDFEKGKEQIQKD